MDNKLEEYVKSGFKFFNEYIVYKEDNGEYDIKYIDPRNNELREVVMSPGSDGSYMPKLPNCEICGNPYVFVEKREMTEILKDKSLADFAVLKVRCECKENSEDNKEREGKYVYAAKIIPLEIYQLIESDINKKELLIENF